MISEEYRKLNEQMHEEGMFDGIDSTWYEPQIREIVRKENIKSLVDYGCGVGVFTPMFPELETHNFDPCVPKFNVEPPQCDMLVSFDVLEHVELPYLQTVLRHIKSLFSKVGYLAIATRLDRTKTLPDGTNPHKIVWPDHYWEKCLQMHFDTQQVPSMMEGSACFIIRHKEKPCKPVSEKKSGKVVTPSTENPKGELSLSGSLSSKRKVGSGLDIATLLSDLQGRRS